MSTQASTRTAATAATAQPTSGVSLFLLLITDVLVLRGGGAVI